MSTKRLFWLSFFFYLVWYPVIFAQDSSSTSPFKLEGYVDGYYAYYKDSMGYGYQQFPTIAPRSNSFGLNLIQLNGSYQNEYSRANFTLHFGDMPESAFPEEFNMIKEAYAGIGHNKLWLDAGIFYTHLGTEEVTPKDNFMSINAVGTYFQPSSQAGIRLTYEHSENLIFEGYLMNGYNLIVDNNKWKSVGFDVDYTPFENLNIYYSNYFGDDREPGVEQNKRRLYNNVVLSYTLWEKLNLITGIDFGFQNNSLTGDSTKKANFSNLIGIVNYQLFPKFSISVRADAFRDKNAVLSDAYLNTDSITTGLSARSLSFGIEYKPAENSYIRMEARRIMADSKLKLFNYNHEQTSVRDEIVCTLGVWF